MIKLSKKFLKKEYIKNKKSGIEIAKVKKCSDVWVYYCLKKYGIKTRNAHESHKGKILSIKTKRKMSTTAVWMAHDIRSGQQGRATEIIDRTEFLKEEQKKVFDFLSKHTKLTKAEIDKAIRGELWFNAKDCLKKGIIDKVV